MFFWSFSHLVTVLFYEWNTSIKDNFMILGGFFSRNHFIEEGFIFQWGASLLKILRQPSKKFWPKILTPYFFIYFFFLQYLYLHFLRSCCENIFKILCIVSEKIGKQISEFAILLLASTRSLFTISLKSKVLFQCRCEFTWPTIYGSVAWFPFVW